MAEREDIGRSGEGGAVLDLDTVAREERPTAWLRMSRRNALTIVAALLFAGACLFVWLMAARGTDVLEYRGGRTNTVVIEVEPLDVNRAAWWELALLPGVGEKKARAIVAMRDERGPFRRIEDLAAVQGIGPKTIENLRNRVVVGGRP